MGFDWDANGTLFFTNNGCDQLGNNDPDDQLQRAARPGLFYGFPFCHVYALFAPLVFQQSHFAPMHETWATLSRHRHDVICVSLC